MTDEDGFEITTEIVTQEQVDALNQLLALPCVEGFSVDFDYCEDDDA